MCALDSVLSSAGSGVMSKFRFDEGRRRHAVCRSCRGAEWKEWVGNKPASTALKGFAACISVKGEGSPARELFWKADPVCDTRGQDRKARQGEKKANRVDLCSQLGQVCVWSVNQSLLLEISISSRRLKPNIHPALHENEQGRNKSGH